MGQQQQHFGGLFYLTKERQQMFQTGIVDTQLVNCITQQIESGEHQNKWPQGAKVRCVCCHLQSESK